MALQHSGIDYSEEIADSAYLFGDAFETRYPCMDFLLPFNPVVTDLEGPLSIAFFGFNAYCHEEYFSEARGQQNFAEWCQNSYNPKLCNVMELWQAGLNLQHRGAVYYTNFVKLVLRESCFKKALTVEKRLRQYPDCARLFTKLAISEVEQLRAGGCDIFICFGRAVYNWMCPVACETGIKLIREHHFSRYSRENTETLIRECVQESDKTR